jgi:hypothetical protein
MPTRGVGLHQGVPDARVAEDQKHVGFNLNVGLAGPGSVVNAREQLQAMHLERLAQPRLDLVGTGRWPSALHVRILRPLAWASVRDDRSPGGCRLIAPGEEPLHR